MAENVDFMDDVVSEYLREDTQQTDTPTVVPPVTDADAGGGTPPTGPVDQTPPVDTTQPDDSAFLKEFQRLTGTAFDSIDKVKDFAEKYSKFPEIEEQVKILPELIEAVEKMQNPLNFFKDEVAFKVAMLSKEPQFSGREAIINEVLRGDLNAFDDLKVIAVATSLKAPNGVRNPLRAELRGMNIDPDDVVNNYEDLDDDTKDLLKIRADQYRSELSKLGSEIKTPSFEGTAVGNIINQRKAAKEDFAAKLNQITPIAQGIISEMKELKITDDFAFKLELTPEQLKSYTEELAELLASGQYDVSTSEGKAEVYGAIMDMFKVDFFDKAVNALVSHKTSKVEEEMRRRFNNEKPLDKKEPTPKTGAEEKEELQRVAEGMLAELK